MSRLQTEINRLYGPTPGAGKDGVRALVLELARPAEWPRLAQVWQGVQADLGWPAPAIAVNGVDAYQLWFSLEQALPLAQAQLLLEQLRRRYLADLPSDLQGDRLRLLPHIPDATPPVPPRRVGADAWSAFVTPDLAAVFADTPWLDLPPGDDAQAELLGRLNCTPAADVARLLEAAVPTSEPAASPVSVPQPLAARPLPQAQAQAQAHAQDTQEARQFLLSVVRDAGIDLTLRIDAAKALLR